ncbi:hypothetical protein BC940DRAFT_313980 [Gongronella butleri]|nr:hypothetical protein BC940DRAFT_313980 [Gongronella butleri]
MAYNYDHYDDHRAGPASHYAPPPPQHGYDSYPMTQVHSPSPQPPRDYYDPDENYKGYNNGSPAPAGYHNINEDRAYAATPIEPIDYRERRSCCDTICCGCCTCCPRWMRYICCVLLLLIICLGIVVGVLAAIFKKPSIEFQGLQGDPTFNLTGTTAVLAFNMTFGINNPNVESVTFANVNAQVYYPNYKTPIGNGTQDNVHISSYANTTLYFPMTLYLDATGSDTMPIAQDLINKCNTKSKITIDYTITPTLKIIGIPITISVDSSASFDCPASASEMTGILGSLTAIIGQATGAGGSIPSGLSSYVPSSLKSLIPT